MTLEESYRWQEMMRRIRTIAYVTVTLIAVFAVWWTGQRSETQIRRAAAVNCHQDLVLTNAVNDLHGSIKKFLQTARKARLNAPPTKSNLAAVKAYGEILRAIHIVPPPVCSR